MKNFKLMVLLLFVVSCISGKGVGDAANPGTDNETKSGTDNSTQPPTSSDDDQGSDSVSVPAKVIKTDSQILTILDNNDDAESSSTSGYTYLVNGEGGESLYFGWWESSQDDSTYACFRFQITKAIPADAEITSASFSIRGTGTLNWDDSTHFLELSATDTADAAQFTGCLLYTSPSPRD